MASYVSVTIITLIPVILIEAILLKNILKKNWGESFECSTVINIVSFIAGIILIFILFCILSLIDDFFKIRKIAFFLFSILSLAILIYLEYIVARQFWKDIPFLKLLKALVIANAVTYVSIAILILILPEQGCAREPARRISCTSNLKQIGLSLKQYAMDYNNFFPDKGFEQLRVNDYLVDYGIYNCPSTDTPKGKDDQKLSNENVDYVYRKGLKDSDTPESSRIPIVWDKPANHENYGNVLFLDGHVKGFKGAKLDGTSRNKEVAQGRASNYLNLFPFPS